MRWAGLLLLACGAGAQQFSPRIGYVYPAGGQQGAEFDVTVGGQFLDGVKRAWVTGGGVEVRVMEHTKPMTPAQVNQLREKVKELLAKNPASAEDVRAIAEIRQKIMAFVRRPPNPAISEKVRLQVRVAADAATGRRELRLTANQGVTNPLALEIGQLPEYCEPADAITLPATINGQILPGGVDRYRFPATRGQRLVVAAAARELIPYISDAVPGWFQATLALYDAQGREVEYAGNFRFHPDPVLYYEIPAGGEYTLEVRDSIYRGREDFVYRISVGELPFVTGIFPLGGQKGTPATVAVQGWNLPAAAAAPVHGWVFVRSGERVSNRVPFDWDTVPEQLERGPKQQIRLPVVLNGRIERPGETDVFRFNGRAGEEIVAEVLARRLDSPLDSLLKLTDSSGTQLALNDDHEDKGAALVTHHADSRVSFRLPKKGTYYLHLSDAQHKGGPEYAYRLRVSRPRPDFELRVVPSAINLRAGGSAPVTVYALRRDGFQGEISIHLKDAPPGLALSGDRIPAHQDQVQLTLTSASRRLTEPRGIAIEGRAEMQGRQVRRPGVPAEDMMQAFAYRHLVPAGELLVQVIPAPRRRRP